MKISKSPESQERRTGVEAAKPLEYRPNLKVNHGDAGGPTNAANIQINYGEDDGLYPARCALVLTWPPWMSNGEAGKRAVLAQEVHGW